MFGLAFLVVCGLYVGLALFMARQVGKSTNSRLAKYAVIAVSVLIPLWDVIPGQLYFNHLCKNEGKVKVFKTIEVGKDYFLSNGRPDGAKLGALIDNPHKIDNDFLPIFHIKKIETTVQDKQTGATLGTATDFSYKGGWVSRSLFIDGGGTSCPAGVHFSVNSALLWEVIKQMTESTGGGN